MDNIEKAIQDKVKFSEVTAVSFFHLFNRNLADIVPIASLKKSEDKEGKKNKADEDTGRFLQEKRLFVSFLMDPALATIANSRKDIKYDYMTGFLLFLSSNKSFRYGYSYFKENLKSYIDFLTKWKSFISHLITDISKLPIIDYPHHVFIEINDFLIIKAEQEHLISIDLIPKWFDDIFKIKDDQYDFRIIVSYLNKKSVIEAGIGDGKGKKGELYKSVKRFNTLVENTGIKKNQLIQKIHEEE